MRPQDPPESAPSRARWPVWPAALLLVAATALYCAPLFDNLEYWGRQDWDQFTFRYESARLALARDRVLPTWNPYANGGTVLLAHPHSPVLSPWFGLVLAFGSPLGLRLQVAVFAALGAIGMAILLRRYDASAAGSIAGGIVFMMSSLFALHIAEGHLEWTTLGLMPWLAILITKLHQGRRHVILAALVAASALTFGAVHIPAFYLPFFTLWIVLDAVRTRTWKTAAAWCAVCVLAGLVSSVKLLPMVSFAADHPREVESYQATPARALLAGLLDPRQARLYEIHRDNLDDEPLASYLRGIGIEYYGFHEYGWYIGAAGLALAALGATLTVQRFWPLYTAGLLSVVVALGARSPVDLWGALRLLPLYGQLHVPSRALVAAVFALAIAAGMGLTALAGRIRGHRLRLFVESLVLAMVYVELALIGRTLFRDVFVVPPVALERRAAFAQVAESFPDERYRSLMASAMYPRLLSNTGVIEAYENIGVDRGMVSLPGDAGYRGELYLQSGRGSVEMTRWTMSRVSAVLEAEGPDALVLNQNFHVGWYGERRDAEGWTDVVAADASKAGLVAVPVSPHHREVVLYYRPRSFVIGAWVSGLAFAAALGGLLWRVQ